MSSMFSTLIVMASLAIIGITLMVALSDALDLKERGAKEQDTTDLGENDLF